MDYQSLHMKTVVELRKLAKEMHVRVPAGTNKNVIIEMLLEADRRQSETPVNANAVELSLNSNDAVVSEAEEQSALEAKAETTEMPVVSESEANTQGIAEPELPQPPAPRRRGRPAKNQANIVRPTVGAEATPPIRKPRTAMSNNRTDMDNMTEDTPETPASEAMPVEADAAPMTQAQPDLQNDHPADGAAYRRFTSRPCVIDRREPTPNQETLPERENNEDAAEKKSLIGETSRTPGARPFQNRNIARMSPGDTRHQFRAQQQFAARGGNDTPSVRGVQRQDNFSPRYPQRQDLSAARDMNNGMPPRYPQNQDLSAMRDVNSGMPPRYPQRQDLSAAREGNNGMPPRYPQRQDLSTAREGNNGVPPRYPQRQDLSTAREGNNGVPPRYPQRQDVPVTRDVNNYPSHYSRSENVMTWENNGQSRYAPRTEDVSADMAEIPQRRYYEHVDSETYRPRREGYYNAEYRTSNPAVPEMLSTGECLDGAGVLEIQPDGYGFLRAENCLPGNNDVYISIAQIRRFNLRMGDYVVGKTRPQREGDRYSAMLYITEINGEPPEHTANRRRFEDLVPTYPNERLRLEPAGESDLSLRLIDMLAPIGKGQRGMIVSQPKAGKTTLLKKIANAITSQYPDIHLIVLLIDERPEEVTDMKRSINGEVIYSTFDEMPENHTRVAEMVLERAQRLVEMGKDVVVLMDSITRLARAYNLVITPTGRSLSGGLDPGALFKPKRFFGAARNIENGGSLTVIATALIDTGSRMDDIIYEEFKGTGNMGIHLDRKLSDRRIFPAIDMVRSGTRREELLLTESEQEGALQVRRLLSGSKSQEMSEQLISMMEKTSTNEDFFQRMKGWMSVYEKEGFSLAGK